jgi:hypothetical protein
MRRQLTNINTKIREFLKLSDRNFKAAIIKMLQSISSLNNLEINGKMKSVKP